VSTRLLLSDPDIDLNICAQNNQSALGVAVSWCRTDQVELLCARFLDLDFTLLDPTDRSCAFNYPQPIEKETDMHHRIDKAIHKAVYLQLPNFKNSVIHLLTNAFDFPQVLALVVMTYLIFPAPTHWPPPEQWTRLVWEKLVSPTFTLPPPPLPTFPTSLE
jgi:hypothetical protein